MARLASYFLLLSLATTTLVGTIAFLQARVTLRQLVFERLDAVATLKEAELQSWVSRQREEFLFIAHLPELQRLSSNVLDPATQPELADQEIDPVSYQALSDFLEFLVDHNRSFEEILILTDTGGKIIVSTEKEHEGEYRVLDSYFTQGRLGTYLQNVYPSPVTGKPTMTVSTPLLSEDGQRLGVIAAHFSLSQMDNIIRERSGLGESGESYLVDRYNVFVSGEGFGRQLFPRGVHTEAIDAAVSGQDGSGLYLNYEGVPVIGAYHWIDNLDLALVAEMHQTEAFAPAQQLALTILLVGLISAAVLAAGVYILARQIARPILVIAETAVQVAGGDLTPTVPVTGNDEIGLLARAFNQMTRQLRLLYSGLEQKVTELQQVEAALQQHARRLEIQHQTDRAILEAQLPEEIAAAALHHLRFLVPCQRTSVTLFDFETQEARVLTANTDRHPPLKAGERVPLSNIRRLADLRAGRPFLTADVREEPVDTAGHPLLSDGMRSYMSVPLLWGGELIGSLNLGASVPDLFTLEHMEIAREVADQLAVAIRQAQLFTATQRQLKELTVLHAVTAAGTELMSEDELIRRATQMIGQILYPDNFGVGLVDEAAGVVHAHSAYQGADDKVYQFSIPLGEGITGKVARDGQPRRIADISRESDYIPLDRATRSELCVPLKVGERVIGIINAESNQPDAFTEADERLLLTVAGQLAIAIEKVRLFEKAQAEVNERRRAELALREAHDKLEVRVAERTAELTLLNRASQALISTLELDQVLVTVLEELRNLLDVVACSAWLTDTLTGELVCRQNSGPPTEQVRGLRLPPGVGIVGWVVQQGSSLLLDDALLDERHHAAIDQKVDLPTRSLLTVPLIVQGRAIGALQAIDSDVGRFNHSDLALMESLAATAAFAIENARLYKQARHDAGTKSILLSEVNHRVKNNLSAIIGLLYAERRHAGVKDHPVYQSIMKDLINRVQGLATVHTLLSASEWAPISLSELTTRVVFSSLRALPPDKRLSVTVAPSPVFVTADQASHLALVINELATNSAKYAMDSRPQGQLEVHIEQAEGMILFEMSDDGPGFPDDVLRREAPRYNVGFHLIQNIVQHSLSGTLTLSNRSGQPASTGAVTRIRFKARVPYETPEAGSNGTPTNELEPNE